MLPMSIRGRDAELALARKVLDAHGDNDRIALLLGDLCDALGARQIAMFRINAFTQEHDGLTLYQRPSENSAAAAAPLTPSTEAAAALVQQAKRDLGGWEPIADVRVGGGRREVSGDSAISAWVQLPAGHPHVWCVGALREAQDGPFPDDHQAALVRAAWTTLLISMSQRSSPPADPLGSSSWALTRTLPVGIAMVNAEREVLYCNEAMRELIAHRDALDLQGNRLVALREDDDDKLGALVRRVASGTDPASDRSFMALTRPSPHPAYGVAIERVSNENISDAPVVTIQISEPDRGLELSRTAIRTFFGLTPTEAEIAARLADGDDISEIAAALDIRPGTVRVHLRSIYRKTRVTRQGELVRLVL